MTKFLVDTNILLRAVDRSALEHPIILHAISTLKRRGDSVFVTPQVLIEFMAVATRPINVKGFGWERNYAISEMENIRSHFALIDETPRIFDEWRGLISTLEINGKQVHDARLVAVCKANGIDNLLTFNTEDFARYPGITVLTPAQITA